MSLLAGLLLEQLLSQAEKAEIILFEKGNYVSFANCGCLIILVVLLKIVMPFCFNTRIDNE